MGGLPVVRRPGTRCVVRLLRAPRVADARRRCGTLRRSRRRLVVSRNRFVSPTKVRRPHAARLRLFIPRVSRHVTLESN